MKIDLNIYQSILFGDLRSWLDDNKAEDKFKAKLTTNFKNPAHSSIELDNTIFTALKGISSTFKTDDYSFDIAEDNEKFKSITDEILYPLIEINFAEPTNNKTSFYYYLIQHEATRILNNLYKLSLFNLSEQEKKYTFVNAIKRINNTLKESTEQQNQLSKNKSVVADKNTDYIFSTLQLTLIRLHLEVKELFERYVAGYVFDEVGVYENILKQTPPTETNIKGYAGLNNFNTTNYINKLRHNKNNTLEHISTTLKQLDIYSSTETTSKENSTEKNTLLQNLLALENIYFIQLYKVDAEEISYTFLLNEDAQESIFTDVWQTILETIETHNLPNKRLIAINKEIQKLVFLNFDTKTPQTQYLQSIPRKLNDVLNATKTFVNANLTIDFAKLVEGKTPPLKANLSVGEIALLFRMLYDLKPDIFDEKTKATLHKFIASNFTTKKSKEGNISTDTISKKFNNPDNVSIDFWVKHCHTLLANLKKYKEV